MRSINLKILVAMGLANYVFKHILKDAKQVIEKTKNNPKSTTALSYGDQVLDKLKQTATHKWNEAVIKADKYIKESQLRRQNNE